MFVSIGLLRIIGIASSGFVLANFFSLPILIAITVFSLPLVIGLIGNSTSNYSNDVEITVSAIFVPGVILLNVVMWITYYITTEQSWIGDFFKTYIFK